MTISDSTTPAGEAMREAVEALGKLTRQCGQTVFVRAFLLPRVEAVEAALAAAEAALTTLRADHAAEVARLKGKAVIEYVLALVREHRADRLHDDTALATAVARARREALEEAKAVAKAMTEKHGDAVGDAYTCGTWDQGVRIQMQIDKLLAATPPEARQTETGWEDIASAPKDKTAVIIAVPSLHAGQPMIVGEAYFDPEHDGWWWAGQSWGDYHASPIAETNAPPVLWQPLPAPPPPAIGNLEGESRS